MKNNVWIIGPLLTLSYLSTLSINTDSETNLLLFNYLLFRDNAEVAFHLQQKIYFPKFIALIISFPIYFFMLNKIKESTFKKLALTLFISSIFCFLIGYLYGLYGAKFWPEPRLLALSPTRALGIYQLFFWILLCLSIYKFNTYQIYKICLFVSIFYLLTLSVDSVLFTLFVFLVALLTINYYKRRNFLNLKNLILNKSTKLTYFSTLLFFLILSPGVFYLFATHLKHVDTYALKNINKWTMGPMEHDNNRLDTAIMLQKCNDFNLLDLKINSEGKPQYWEWTSAIAGKSNYYGGVNWNYFDKETYHTSKHRQKIIFNIINNMQKKIEINHQDKDELLKTGVIAIIYDDERKYFSKDITSFDLENNDTLLVFLKGDKKENFSNNCVKHLKIK